MKAICPRCSHVTYWFYKDELSPEHERGFGLDDRCPYDGASTVSATGNENNHNCAGCAKRGIIDGRTAEPGQIVARNKMD